MATLLVDEATARQFFRDYLWRYHPGSPRLVQCVARKKYAKDDDPNFTWQGPGQLPLDREILTFDHENPQVAEDAFIRALRKFEILADAGYYVNPRQPGHTVPLEWMVVYITMFPLDENDAADAFVTKVLETRKLERQAHSNGSAHGGLTRILSKVKTLLHQHPVRQCRWLKLDVDTKDSVLIAELQDVLQGATVLVAAETRGGYHVVLEKGPWCRHLYSMAARVNRGVPKEEQWLTIEDNSGPMLAIPGTNQGGFAVKLVTDKWRQGRRQHGDELSAE